MSQYESLCIVKKRDEYSEPTFYRIGDIKDGYISQAYYDFNMPITIGNRKGEEKIVESIQVRLWRPREDDERRNDSRRTNTSVFEVVFCNDTFSKDDYDEAEIRKHLYSGVNIPKGLSGDFLLVLPSNEQFKTAIVCNTRDFILKGTKLFLREDCSDLLHIKPCFDLIKISADEIVSTEVLYERVSVFNSDETRYFFSYLDLDDLKTGVFKAYPLEKYASNYIKSFLIRKKKELEITKKDINSICNLFDDLVRDQYLLEYFETTGYSVSEITNFIKSNTSTIATELLGLDDISIFINKVLKEDFRFYSSCLSAVREEWFNIADDRRSQIEKELSELKDKEDALITTCKDLEGKAEKLHLEIEEAERVLEQLDAHKQVVESEISTKLQKFKNSVVEIAFSQALSTHSSVSSTTSNSESFLINSQPNNEILLEDLYELSECLVDNLVKGGMKENYSKDCAQYLISTVILKRSLIIPSTISKNIADALSSTIDSCNAAIVICPNNYDANSLVNTISEIHGRVVLVKNCIDIIRTDLMEAIVLGCKDKILIFDYYDSNNLKYVPRSISKLSSVFQDDSIMIPIIQPEYERFSVSKELITIPINKIALNERFKLFQLLKGMIDIDDHGLYTLSAIETAISEIEFNKSRINIFNILSEATSLINEDEFERWLQEFLSEEKTDFVLKQLR